MCAATTHRLKVRRTRLYAYYNEYSKTLIANQEKICILAYTNKKITYQRDVSDRKSHKPIINFDKYRYKERGYIQDTNV